MAEIPGTVPRLKGDGRVKRSSLREGSPPGVQSLATNAVAGVDRHRRRDVTRKVPAQRAGDEFD